MTLQEDLPAAGRGLLLAPDEPAPYFMENEDGAAPVLLLCDHASRFIPRQLNKLGLDEAELARHIAWDIGAADVTRELSRHLDAPAMFSHFSRLIVDPNRGLDDPTLVPQISDGTIISGNRGLSPQAIEARIASFHRPYHQAVDRAIAARLSRGETPAIVSIHSFTPVIRGVERPWEIGILWCQDARIPGPLIERLRARGLTVGDNEPYSAREGLGYTIELHADPRALPNVLIEVRQDLIDTHHGAADWATVLAEELAPVLNGLDLATGEDEAVPA